MELDVGWVVQSVIVKYKEEEQDMVRVV